MTKMRSPALMASLQKIISNRNACDSTANTHIVGEKGTILNDRFYLERFAGQQDFFTVDTGVKKSGDVYSHPFPAMVAHFIECLKQDRDSEHNVASAVNSHKACFAICESAANGGEWITLT